jgi:hypothetical protein
MFQIFFILLGSAWQSVVQEHRLNRKTPLYFITHKVSTIFLSYFNFPMMLPIYQFIGLDDESFSRKVVSAAATGDQSLWILHLRVLEDILKKNLAREGKSTCIYKHHNFSLFLIYILIYANTFSLTRIEDELVEGTNHRILRTQSNSRDHSRIS